MSHSTERDLAAFSGAVIVGGLVALFLGFGLLPLVIGGLSIWAVASFADLLTKK